MRIHTNRQPKTGKGKKIKSDLIKLSDEHSFAILKNPDKAKILSSQIKRKKQQFRFHEAAEEYRQQIEKLQRQIKELPKGSSKRTQLELFLDSKKRLLRKIESKIE